MNKQTIKVSELKNFNETTLNNTNIKIDGISITMEKNKNPDGFSSSDSLLNTRTLTYTLYDNGGIDISVTKTFNKPWIVNVSTIDKKKTDLIIKAINDILNKLKNK